MFTAWLSLRADVDMDMDADADVPPVTVHCRHSTLSQHRNRSLAVAAVPELSVLSDLQLGGVGGGDAVATLHAVALLQLGQGAHQTGVGCVQRCDTLLL